MIRRLVAALVGSGWARTRHRFGVAGRVILLFPLVLYRSAAQWDGSQRKIMERAHER